MFYTVHWIISLYKEGIENIILTIGYVRILC